jgi:hypothetical protein
MKLAVEGGPIASPTPKLAESGRLLRVEHGPAPSLVDPQGVTLAKDADDDPEAHARFLRDDAA